MRTTKEIDEDLLKAAMKAGGFRTRREAVEAGLRLVLRQSHYRYIQSLRGKLRWQGDLRVMRRDT